MSITAFHRDNDWRGEKDAALRPMLAGPGLGVLPGEHELGDLVRERQNAVDLAGLAADRRDHQAPPAVVDRHLLDDARLAGATDERGHLLQAALAQAREHVERAPA